MNAAAMTPATKTDFRALLGLSYTPSTYQAGVFSWVLNGLGHGVARAVAGSGKTTTIVSAARLLDSDGLFVAFNKSIADELGERLQGTRMSACTVHSHGFAAIREGLPGLFVKVFAGKYKTMLRDAEKAAKVKGSLCGTRLTAEQRKAITEDGFPVGESAKLIDLARLSLVDFDADDFDGQLADLAAHHDLDVDPLLWPLVVTAVQNCLRLGCDTPATRRGGKRPVFEIDFTDMLWLPTILGLRPRMVDWLFVDECQDISAAARQLIRNSVTPRGRILWVGDPRQAIYGFAGADAESFAAIVRECDAVELPLSVCYRCPTSHLAVAREWCPEIEARPGAPVGEIRTVERAAYLDDATDGDLVVCRRNAPLLEMCWELIAAGVPAHVKGRDMAAGLCAIVIKVAKVVAWSEFRSGLAQWSDEQAAFLTKKIVDEDRLAEAVAQLDDKVECIRVIWARSNAESAEALCAAIEDLFSDERGAVVLSSVHRAKGLEAERVVILQPERLGWSPWAKQPWQIEQEQNIAYVAYTRSKSVIIEIPERGAGERDSGERADSSPIAKPRAQTLPTSDSIARAWRTLISGENHLRDHDVSDREIADAHQD